MKASRFATPLLFGATLILLCANALPAALHKHRLQDEMRRVTRDLQREVERAERLQQESDAARTDPFYLERLTVETWKGVPPGAIRWEPNAPRQE